MDIITVTWLLKRIHWKNARQELAPAKSLIHATTKIQGQDSNSGMSNTLILLTASNVSEQITFKFFSFILVTQALLLC